MSAPGNARTGASRKWVLAAVVMASLGLTIFATYYAYRTVLLQAQETFNLAIVEAHGAVQTRIGSYIALLRGASALMTAERDVSRSEFREFVEHLRISELYPGIQGIGFTSRVPPGQEESLLAAIHAEGLTNFTLWPKVSGEAAHTILYLEPVNKRNRAALGYNMYTEPVRRYAMQKACDTGAPVASGRVKLVQEIEGPVQAGFLIYLPVYEAGEIPATVAGRREALKGFVYSPFRADDLFRSIFAGRATTLDIEVYDQTISPDNVLHRHEGTNNPVGLWPHKMEQTLPLTVASRQWALRFIWNGGYSANWFLAPAIFIVGSLLTIVLGVLLRSEGAARDRTEQANEQLRLSEQSLKEARSRLEQHAQNLEGRVQERTQLLQESVQDLEAVLYHVAHDLRAPVRAMGSFATLLNEEYAHRLEARAIDYLDRIAKSAARMDRLVNDLLAFGRLSQAPLPEDVVPLEKPVREVLKQKRQQIEKQSAAVLVQEPLPAVKANPELLKEIIAQLVDNSLKFTSPGAKPHVRIWATNGSVVRLHIQDNGIGVRPEYHERIFRVFEKLHPHGIYPGTGIGLAIVRKAVERMGGRAGVDSAADQGSTFWIELPGANS